MPRQIIFGIFILATVVAFFSTSCDKDSTTEPKTETINLTKVSGDNQEAVLGDTLSTPLVVLVTDDSGRALSERRVDFRITAGIGTLIDSIVVTDNDGKAETTLILGEQEGQIQVEAKVYGTEHAVTFTSTSLPQPFFITIISGNNQQGVQDDTLSTALTVLVTDKDGKAVTNKQVDFTIKEGEGILSAGSINTNDNGQASATLILGNQQGLIRVEAKISGTNITALFTAVIGIHKPYSIEIAGGDGQVACPGETLTEPLQVVIKDDRGRPFEGAVVTFSIDEGTGSLSALSDTSSVYGTAQTILTLSDNVIAETNLTAGDIPVTIKVTAYAEVVDSSVEFTITIISSLIAFESYHNDFSISKIWVMNCDGSNKILISQNEYDQLCSWTPDGKILFYNFYDNHGIYTINPNGSNIVCISSEHYLDVTLSPDGTKIAYARQNADLNWEIYIMNSDASNKVQLTNNHYSSRSPAWSPDGTKIAYTASSDYTLRGQEIYIMNSDGTNQTRLTNNSDQDYCPKWSPDGSELAFFHGGENDGLYTMSADGSNQVYVNDNPPYYYYGSLSPHGTKVVYSSDDDGDFEIYAMDINGSNIIKLTDNTYDDVKPLWSPILSR